ncbi:MAG: hypothetical protein QOJ79_1262 [Actinomycetota bacterium]|nr:hypothetical protein [Actinomycetota bacterium]
MSSAVICEVLGRAWEPPPAGDRCDPNFDFGPDIEVKASGVGTFFCGTDEPLAGYSDYQHPRPLAYGHAMRLDQFECVSSRVGMQCENKKNGHGFFVNRASYRLF